jgi:cobalt/nickel transport protein
MKPRIKSGILGAAIAALVTFTLVAATSLTMLSPLGGTDDQAAGAIKTLAPAYKPWLNSTRTTSDPETERVLFALQAAIGAAFIGYYCGYSIKRTKDNATKPVIKRAY